jgi:putative ABC transport system substrate-binding protein
MRRTGGMKARAHRAVCSRLVRAEQPAPSTEVKPPPLAQHAPLRRLPSLRLAAACMLVVAFTAPASTHAARLVIVQAHDSPRLAKTLAALQARATVPVEVLRLPAEHDAAFESALAKQPRDHVIVALGPRASDFVVRLNSAHAAVHCLAGPDALRAGLPAVPSEAPADQHALWLRKLVPAARRVGVLYDPALNTRRAEAAAAALEMAGYKVLLQPVGAPAALPTALASLAGRADVLFAVPDRMVYTPETAKGILLFSFRNGIPLIGPDEAWVRKGALFAVDWDYAEVGAACAALAQREGSTRAPPAALRPRAFVNPRIATRFDLAWDAALLATPGLRHE